jgi:hypothetical protein
LSGVGASGKARGTRRTRTMWRARKVGRAPGASGNTPCHSLDPLEER